MLLAGDGRELEAESGGLLLQISLEALKVKFFLLCKDGGIIFAAMGKQMMDDAGKLVRGRGDGGRHTELGLYPAKVIPELRWISMEGLRG